MAGFPPNYIEVLTRVETKSLATQLDARDPVLSVLFTAMNRGHFDSKTVNPFCRKAGETFPRGFFYNHQGLLVRKITNFNLDSDSQLTVEEEIPFQSSHIIIVCVVEGKP
ncbi:hypothetical protein KC19_VG082300 [Ceratodon purpureus]|uniref:Uncharacterized protein n=1 Tax=Ceratodon purpureus TaxID=3225 RepID=A0A8T0HN86_CERPU|nr:hypothetical protein KC19_VG082300 [Ceratodon purpureus]